MYANDFGPDEHFAALFPNNVAERLCDLRKVDHACIRDEQRGDSATMRFMLA